MSSYHDDESILDAHPTMRSAKLLDCGVQARHSKSNTQEKTAEPPCARVSLHFNVQGCRPLEKSESRHSRKDHEMDHKLDWEVQQLPETSFPQFLERSHKRIDGILPSTIAHYIASWMRENSITVEFDHVKAIAYGQCGHVKFRVYMYQATLDAHENCISGSHVIVEVQRRSGCCLEFHKIANGILCAATGENYKVPQLVAGDIPDDVKTSFPWIDHDAVTDNLPQCSCSFWTYSVHKHDCEHFCDNQ